jgi:hypothetical protein
MAYLTFTSISICGRWRKYGLRAKSVSTQSQCFQLALQPGGIIEGTGQFVVVYASSEAVAEPVRISIAIRVWCSGFRMAFQGSEKSA